MSTLHYPPTPHLVIGGCRSGKSAHAEQLMARFPPPYRYVATARIQDQEMADRVQAHRQRRGDSWHTVEAPLKLPQLLRELSRGTEPILVDCVTMWLTNLLLDPGHTSIPDQVEHLCQILRQTTAPILLVSNEVGTGIVPENQLARTFRDLAGYANQQIASACRAVTWTVAGIPVRIKPASRNGAA